MPKRDGLRPLPDHVLAPLLRALACIPRTADTRLPRRKVQECRRPAFHGTTRHNTNSTQERHRARICAYLTRSQGRRDCVLPFSGLAALSFLFQPFVDDRGGQCFRLAAGVLEWPLNRVPVWEVDGAVAGLVGIGGGVVSEVINLESSGVEAPDRRPRHDQPYYELRFRAAC
jgi:hypothetical protein